MLYSLKSAGHLKIQKNHKKYAEKDISLLFLQKDYSISFTNNPNKSLENDHLKVLFCHSPHCSGAVSRSRWEAAKESPEGWNLRHFEKKRMQSTCSDQLSRMDEKRQPNDPQREQSHYCSLNLDIASFRLITYASRSEHFYHYIVYPPL